MEEYPTPGVEDLIALKVGGKEGETLGRESLADHEARVRELMDRLEDESKTSRLRDAPTSFAALSDFLVRLRIRPLQP